MAAKLLLPALLSLSATLGGENAIAAERGVMPGVKHLALIIANDDYDLDGVLRTKPSDVPPAGMLKDLANPCRDANQFRDSLIASNWKPEEITFICNIRAAKMRELINNFKQTIVSMKNTVGIVYFSGHGAQFSDSETPHNFIFGSGVTIDLDKITESLKSSPKNTSFIANDAIDLTEIVDDLGSQTENAVLVVIDACRDNPLYGQISEIDNSPEIKHLFYDSNFDGIVVTFAVPSGAVAVDGPGKHSAFSAALSSMLSSSRDLDNMLNHLPQKMKEYYDHWKADKANYQSPKSRGRFLDTWCVWACKPGAEPPPVDRPFEDLTVAGPQLRRPSLSGLRLASYQPGASTPASQNGGSVEPTANTQNPDPALTTDQATMAQSLSAAAQPQTRSYFDLQTRPEGNSLKPSSPIRLDVFWCDGGAGADDRFQRASDLTYQLQWLAEAGLKKATSGPSATADMITSVRLRRLSQGANVLQGYRYRDDAVLYDSGDARELSWSQQVVQASQNTLSLRSGAGRTPGYISVFFCRAPRRNMPVTTRAYLQVPTLTQKEAGLSILKQLALKIPPLQVSKGIEVRSDGPQETEVRFFDDEARDTAFVTARALEDILHRPVRIQFMPQYATAKSSGHVEIWQGRSDEPLSFPAATDSGSDTSL